MLVKGEEEVGGGGGDVRLYVCTFQSLVNVCRLLAALKLKVRVRNAEREIAGR